MSPLQQPVPDLDAEALARRLREHLGKILQMFDEEHHRAAHRPAPQHCTPPRSAAQHTAAPHNATSGRAARRAQRRNKRQEAAP